MVATRVSELVEGVGDVTGTAVRALATPSGAVGAAVEAVWSSAHLCIYPLGLLPGASTQRQRGLRTHDLPPAQRSLVVSDVEASGTPILLVHGMVDNSSIFTMMRLGLRRRGFGTVTTMNYSILTNDVRSAADTLAGEVERICETTGYDRIHVIGHSLGGLIARYHVTRRGGDARVHTLVTLGTPHAGTYAAYTLPTQLSRQLRPGSDLMHELSAPAPGCRTRFICYWSDLDQMIFPQQNAALVHPDLDVTNVPLHGVGHMTIPILGSVVHSITSRLAHIDSDGAPVPG